jgi:hypothetical protein
MKMGSLGDFGLDQLFDLTSSSTDVLTTPTINPLATDPSYLNAAQSSVGIDQAAPYVPLPGEILPTTAPNIDGITGIPNTLPTAAGSVPSTGILSALQSFFSPAPRANLVGGTVATGYTGSATSYLPLALGAIAILLLIKKRGN